jgi:hypothetical protein
VLASAQAALAAPLPATLARLLHQSSKKHLVETAASHGGSLLFKKAAVGPDVIHVVALRVEFKSDTNLLTTGDGLFGMNHDQQEQTYYKADTVYKYDNLPHYLSYFNSQFEFVKKYFATVSRGRLDVEYSVFPSGDIDAYSVPSSMSVYSPGYKPKNETWDNYYERKTVGLMRFVADAIKSADKNNGPFASLSQRSDGTIVDSLGRKTVFMIIHAGASFLTDGGTQGSAGANTPSDMIDAFISKQFFEFFKDTIKLDTTGVKVSGAGGVGLVIDEAMMCSETSNQDGLNFGIHGIMVNQIARQIGIPDLFSTSSGMTAVGGFCIMDPYGYSAASGFIPPWPSAWVRAFMGWDSLVTVRAGEAGTFRLKAVSAGQNGESTILQVPINSHEYYLIENRQRNLSENPVVFKWDTGKGVRDTIVIDPSFSVNLDSRLVTDSLSNDDSHVIVSAKNYDIGIPASGILVWHVDEDIIRDKINFDMLNADSNYKAVKLEEADGIADLGILGRDIFYNPVFDFGGEEDVFPHLKTDTTGTTILVDSMGPFTGPTTTGSFTGPPTTSNDGGKTYLSIKFGAQDTAGKLSEQSLLYGNLVRDFSDSVFTVSVQWDFLAPGWPKRTLPEKLFEPAVFGAGASKKLAVLSQSGRLYVWPSGTGSVRQTRSAVVPYSNLRGAVQGTATTAVLHSDTVLSDIVTFDSLPGAFTFPTVISGTLVVPSLTKRLFLVTGTSDSSISIDTTPVFSWTPSTYVCNLPGKYWALGSTAGVVYMGDPANLSAAADSIRLGGSAAVCAIAALPRFPDSLVCIQSNDSLSLLRIGAQTRLLSVHIDSGHAPYSLVTGDINNDSMPEIIVCDSRKGLWVFKTDLTPAPGWSRFPNQWASALDTSSSRLSLPVNLAPPSLADINGDGFLDIIAGGTSGVYALNYKGVPISGWPAILDNRFWRGNIACSPVVTKSASTGNPLVIYSSATGENNTWEIDSIRGTNKAKGEIYYARFDGTLDTLKGVTAGFIDSSLVFGDSLVLPIVLPGGFVDALDKTGKRPLFTIGANHLYSKWPLTMGAPAGTSPLLDDLDNNGSINLVAAATNGWVYRWRLGRDIIGDSILWQETGYNGSRCFAYLGPVTRGTLVESAPITFFTYPNPTNGSQFVVFKYKFSAAAQNVRLDVFTMAGLHVFSRTGLSGSFPDFNELSPVSLSTFGPGVYRCRLEAVVGGTKHVNYWKMAVVK